jgi:hypothetical protein
MADAQFLVNGFICPDASTLYAVRPESIHNTHWWNKVNSIRNYRGRRPGEAHLLITQEMINSIPLVPASSSSVELSVRVGTNLTSFGNWFVTKLEAIETLAEFTDQRLFYLELKDPRYVASLTYVADSWSILSSTFQYVTSSGVTWQTVLNALWALMPTDAYANTGTCPTLPSTPASFAENLNFDGVPLWRAICQTLDACGYFPVYDPINGTYRFAEHNQTQSGLLALFAANVNEQIWESSPVAMEHNTPEDITIIFQPQLHSRITHATYAKPNIETLPSGVVGSVSGTQWSLVDTTFCVLTNGMISNGSQMDNRVLDLRKTLRGKAKALTNAYTYTYRGLIMDFLPGEEVSSVVICDSNRRGDYTQVELFEPYEFDFPQAPDRAYSLVEVVLITSNTPDVNGYYDGVVQRWNHGTLSWDSLYTCKVKDTSV